VTLERKDTWRKDHMEEVSDLITLNSEHSVYYAISMNPHCKVCFIAGMYNTPTLTADKITAQMSQELWLG